MARWLDARDTGFAEAFAALLSLKRETDEDVSVSVRAIIAEVRSRGDAAYASVRLAPRIARRLASGPF